MGKGKFRVLMRMVEFDHSLGKYYDVKPSSSMKWGKESIYVLCDASAIKSVIRQLGDRSMMGFDVYLGIWIS